MRSRSALAARLPAVAALAAAVAVCAVPAGATASVYGSAAANRALARATATRLLGDLHLPSGAQRSAGPPAAAHGQLSHIGYDELTPNLVDAHTWWTVSGSPASILGHVAAHLPHGAGRSGGTVGGSSGVQERNWESSPRPGVAQRILSVSAISIGDGESAVRLDGEAVWLTPRPAWERIPTAIVSATITGHGPTASGRPGPASRPRTLPPATAHALAVTIDGFEAFQPGAYSCPAGFDETITVTFDGAGHRRLATAVESPTGCASVRLTIGGRRGLALVDGAPGGRSVTDELLHLHAIDACRAAQLASGTVSDSTAPGQPLLVLSLRDRARALCSLRGFARLSLTDARGDRAGGPDRRRGAPGPATVLYPGMAAQFTASYARCPSRPPATRARVTLPGSASPLMFALPSGARRVTPCPTGLTLGPLTAPI